MREIIGHPNPADAVVLGSLPEFNDLIGAQVRLENKVDFHGGLLLYSPGLVGCCRHPNPRRIGIGMSHGVSMSSIVIAGQRDEENRQDFARRNRLVSVLFNQDQLLGGKAAA